MARRHSIDRSASRRFPCASRDLRRPYDLDWALLLSQQIFQSQGNMTKVDSFIDQGASTRLLDWNAPAGGVRTDDVTILYPAIRAQSKDPQNKGCVTTVITTKRRDQTKVQALLSFYPHEGLPEAAVRFACQLDEMAPQVMGSPCCQFRVALTRQYFLTTADIFKICRDACSGPTWGLPILLTEDGSIRNSDRICNVSVRFSEFTSAPLHTSALKVTSPAQWRLRCHGSSWAYCL